jgi:hypothetical protein
VTEVHAGCVAYDEELSAMIDAELSAEREAELREHIAGCARCALRLEELCNVDLELASLGAPEVPGDLAARLEARIAAQATAPAPASGAPAALRPRSAAPARRRRSTGARFALAAAAAAGLLAVWVAIRSDEPGPLERPLAQARQAVEPPIAEARQAPDLTEPEIAQAPPAQDPVGAGAAEQPVAMAEVGLSELSDLEEEDVAMLIELDAVEDFDVIANLELLERFLAAEASGGAG